MPFRSDRIHVRNDIFADVLAKFQDPLIGLLRRIDLDEENVAAAKHVGHDAGGPRALHRIILVEDKLGVPSADIQDSHAAQYALLLLHLPGGARA